MKKIIVTLFCTFSIIAFSQDIDRITINGRIIVSAQDKEGVTVYNTSSNKGTVTDEIGEFKIDVAINDVVEFGALQFKDFTVVISEQILESKQMTVILVEEVNKLDEVVLLPFGLTGNLNADLENVGIRPGEKLHEQMIGLEDSPFTYEYSDYFKILPSINSWCKYEDFIKDGKQVDENFSYTSDKNNDWMTSATLKLWLKNNLDKLGDI